MVNKWSFSFPSVFFYGMLLPAVVTTVLNHCGGREMVLRNWKVRKQCPGHGMEAGILLFRTQFR